MPLGAGPGRGCLPPSALLACPTWRPTCAMPLLPLLPLLAVAGLGSGSESPCFVEPLWPPAEVVNISGCGRASIASGGRCAWSVPPNRTNIQYGTAWNPTFKRQEPLLLDLYLPPASDTRTRRPGFVLMHGGGFIGGDKARHGAGPGVEAYMAAALAQRGFVAVSINYRLAKPDPRKYNNRYGVSQTNASYVIDAVHDLKAAVRYMRKNANAWGVDPAHIGAGGESAGGIAVEFLDFVPVSEGHSGAPGPSSHVSVVLSISGALVFDTACSMPHGASGVICNGTLPAGTWNYTSDIGRFPGQPPIVMVHGTYDTVVPFREALAVHARATAANISNTLVTVPHAGHVPYEQLLGLQESDPAVLRGSAYMNATMQFIYKAMSLWRLKCPVRTPRLVLDASAA